MVQQQDKQRQPIQQTIYVRQTHTKRAKRKDGVDSKHRPKIRLTLRDFQILETLHTARYLTTPQLQKLFWRESKGGKSGRTKACQQRLRLLCQHRFVRRIELPIKRGESTKPYIYALDRLGAALLVSELSVDPGEIDWRPRSQEEHYPFLEHLLTTYDFRIALSQACQVTGVVLQEWIDEKELKSEHNIERVTIVGPQGGTMQASLVPDGYFQLSHHGKSSIFFIEVDLKTVTIAPSRWEKRGWMKRIRSYDAFFKSENYRSKYGDRRARVLTIMSGKVRLTNLKRATEIIYEQLREMGEDTSAQESFWFTLFSDEMEPKDLLTAPIWHVAGSDKPRALLE